MVHVASLASLPLPNLSSRKWLENYWLWTAWAVVQILAPPVYDHVQMLYSVSLGSLPIGRDHNSYIIVVVRISGRYAFFRRDITHLLLVIQYAYPFY